MGCVVKIWWKDGMRIHARAPWNYCETELADFQEVCLAVEADQLLALSHLWCRMDSDGNHIVYDRQPCAARGSAIARVELPRGRFVTEEA